MSSGVYDPLSPLPNSIRVVRIAPTNSFGVDRVVCQLNETTWDACDYEALSYCWGKRGPKDLADILLNGDTVAVTKDLHEALRQLSLPDRIRTIWIDALCINQNDQDEKASQVQRMGEIYRNAQRVVVWIGPGAPDTEATFRQVQELACLDSDDNIKSVWSKGGPWVVHLNELIKRPYWYRAWTVQEVILAKDAVLYCGPHTISFFDMAGVLVHPRTIQYINVTYALYSYLKQVFQLRQTTEDPALGLFAIAYSFRFRNCTVPHDKLYAFLGLLNRNASPTAETFPVDYKQKKSNLWLSATKETMVRFHALLPLALAERGRPTDGSTRWYYDFSKNAYEPNDSMDDTQVFWSDGLDDPRYYPLQINRWSAAGGLAARLRTNLDIDSVIAAQGFTVSKIVAVGPSNSSMLAAFGRPNYWQLFEKWEEVVGGPWKDSEMSRKFALTLTGGAWKEEPQDWRPWNKRKHSQRVWNWRWLVSTFSDGFHGGDTKDSFGGYRPSRQSDSEDSDTAERYAKVRDDACEGRRIFLMENGQFGLGHEDTVVGDQVVVLLGCSVPYVLHKRDWGNRTWRRVVDADDKGPLYGHTWKAIGQAYVHEIMHYEGNLEQDIADGKVILDEFLLD